MSGEEQKDYEDINEHEEEEEEENLEKMHHANMNEGEVPNNQVYNHPIDSNGYDGQQDNEINQNNIVDQISEDIEEKIKVFDEFVKGKSEEQTLNIRMHQLALAKILVFTHGKSHFKLVEAHTKLGIAYLNYKCYEQAIDHLTMALKKNGNLFGEIKDSQVYHADILTQLGKCYLEVQSYEDALELLTKANELYKTVKGENDLSSVPTLNCIAQCYTKMKDYDKAQETIALIYDIQSTHHSLRSEQIAMTMVEHAKILALRQDFIQAIEYQNRAIEVLIEIEYNRPEYVAELYQTLSTYQEKDGKVSDQVESLQKVKTLYKEIYGPTDKKVIKVKRQISMILLKNNQHDAALEELQEIEELESKVYGENSVQVAKTLRIIGTIKILTQGINEAQKYFSKAMKIFEENGMKNQVKEMKEKLKMTKDIKEKKGVGLKQGAYYE
ncbi:hypothetical protein ABPG74_002012 [Tetrahymena malaccensis]